MNYHIFQLGEWTIPGYEKGTWGIPRQTLWNLASKKTPIRIELASIAAYPLHKKALRDRRFVLADISYPIIVVGGLPNPYNKPYKCVDGRHRLYKLKNAGFKTALVFVLSFPELQKCVEKVTKPGLSSKALEQFCKYNQADFLEI